MMRLAVIVLALGNVLLAVLWIAHGIPERPEPGSAWREIPEGLPGITLADEAAGTTAGSGCFSLGPFETAASRDRARAALGPEVAKMYARDTQALMELGYWVALPPFPGLGAAAAAERELRQKGLEDVAVVNAENGQYLVSLGYFLDERNALARRDQVRELGFEADTRLQREPQPRFWLDYRVANGSSNSAELDLVAGKRRAIPCPAELAD